MKVDAQWPVYCPRCGVNLSGLIGEEVVEPEVCEHQLFYHCNSIGDYWPHVTPEFARSYLTALSNSEEYKEWAYEDEEADSMLSRIESRAQQGVPLAEAMEGIPFLQTVAESVCGEDTIVFHLVRVCVSHTEYMNIGVDCSP